MVMSARSDKCRERLTREAISPETFNLSKECKTKARITQPGGGCWGGKAYDREAHGADELAELKSTLTPPPRAVAEQPGGVLISIVLNLLMLEKGARVALAATRMRDYSDDTCRQRTSHL